MLPRSSRKCRQAREFPVTKIFVSQALGRIERAACLAHLRRSPLGISRILCVPERLPHYQVHLPNADPGRVVSSCRFGLADLPVTNAWIPCIPLRCSLRPPWGSIADPVAPRVRRERTTMEGAGQRSEGMANLTHHAHMISIILVRSKEHEHRCNDETDYTSGAAF